MQPEKFNLQNVISGRYNDPEKGWIDQTIELTDEQRTGLSMLFADRAHKHTREALERWANSRFLPGTWSYWAWERIVWEGDRWAYVAGQDYPAEINIIRKWIAHRY